MPISGNLRTMPVVDLLQWIAVARKTGTLIVRGEWKRRIFFDEGQVTLVASDNMRERLGYYLVGWGYLSGSQLEELLGEQQERGRMLGDLLVERGIVPRDELVRMLRVRAEDMIVGLILSGEGEFRFIDHTIPSRASLEVRFMVEQLLFEAARRADELRRLREVVPSNQSVPRVVDHSFAEQLSPHERDVFLLLDGSRSIERAALEARVPEFNVASLVYRGLRGGSLELLAHDAGTPLSADQREAQWANLLREAETCITFGDLLSAFSHLDTVRRDHGDVPEATRRRDAMLTRLAGILDAAQPEGDDLLQLAVDFSDLMKLKFTPEEAFIISRVDGRYTIPQTLSQFPGDRLLARLIVHELVQQGILKLTAFKGLARTTF
jgi:hypothetical protein